MISSTESDICIRIWKWGSSCGVVANVVDCDIVVSSNSSRTKVFTKTLGQV